MALAALAVLAVGLLVRWQTTPPLRRLTRLGDRFLVDVQTLGEYPTSVERVVLRRGSEVVWRIEARRRPAQVHTFQLSVGENPGALVHCLGGPAPEDCRPEVEDAYAAVVPAAGGFVLERGARYTLEVWGSRRWWSRAAVELAP